MLRTKALRKIFLTTLTLFVLLTVFTITNSKTENVLKTNLEIEDIAGFKTDVIGDIEENNEPSVVFDFLCNKDNASKIIEYFKSIGIEKIDELLINKIEIFLVDYDSLIKSFNNYDISTLVQLINEDINAINIVRN